MTSIQIFGDFWMREPSCEPKYWRILYPIIPIRLWFSRLCTHPLWNAWTVERILEVVTLAWTCTILHDANATHAIGMHYKICKFRRIVPGRIWCAATRESQLSNWSRFISIAEMTMASSMFCNFSTLYHRGAFPWSILVLLLIAGAG